MFSITEGRDLADKFVGAPLQISAEELSERRKRFVTRLAGEGMAGAVIFDPASVFYFTNFAFIPTERPIALVMAPDGRSVLLVPRLEREHAEKQAAVGEVRHYDEYPDAVHPMAHLALILRDLGVGTGPVGADHDGYISPWGYMGPTLSEAAGVRVVDCRRLVQEQRMIKSPAEIALIRESARWGNLAHTLLQQYAKPGAMETDVSERASLEATRAMLMTLGQFYRPLRGSGAAAGFRGQVGRNAAIPHAMTINAVFQEGDILVSGAGATVGGYDSELERTMFVTRAQAEERKYFHLMLEVQDLAFDTIRPGIECADVDRAVRQFYKDHGIEAYWRHHTGHGLGLEGHEAPFFDIGDHTVIRPGMVFSVEPGIYVDNLGGFRHSDTILVTENGIERLTYYPRDLESLIC